MTVGEAAATGVYQRSQPDTNCLEARTEPLHGDGKVEVANAEELKGGEEDGAPDTASSSGSKIGVVGELGEQEYDDDGSTSTSDSLGFESEPEQQFASHRDTFEDQSSTGTTDSLGFEESVPEKKKREKEIETNNGQAPKESGSNIYPDELDDNTFQSPVYHTGEYKEDNNMDLASQRRLDQEKEIKASGDEIVEPLKMLKKGATAVVGGTMVGVGLVMIPLPTPCGCVVASSGMALLGSEFKGAQAMNDKIITSTKKSFVSARKKVINKIESMNSYDGDDDSEDETAEAQKEQEDAPKWLNMNVAERKRQEKLSKEKYRKENQSTTDQVKETMTKKTGSYLSRTLIPFLNKSYKHIPDERDDDEEEVSFGAPNSTSSGKAKNDKDSNTKLFSDKEQDETSVIRNESEQQQQQTQEESGGKEEEQSTVTVSI